VADAIAATPDDPRCRAVLAFWFGTGMDDAAVIAEKSAIWFRGGTGVDTTIRTDFAALRAAALEGQLDAWLDAPRGRLALVILVDQFSRNLFRDDPRAYTHDALALAWCVESLGRSMDRALRPIERVFLYLPLEHSEMLADQQRAVALFSALRDEVHPDLRETFNGFLDYAKRHRDVIARFGRFPHRNATLGRASTDQERVFLEQSGSSF
jgi:uncharacterized protein (DUF924 family)